MFDWFHSGAPDLFNPACTCGSPVGGLQTKEFHCELDTYVLRSDGSVLRRFFRDPDDSPGNEPEVRLFHPMDGDLGVYTDCSRCGQRNSWSLEFYAGKLVRVKRVEPHG